MLEGKDIASCPSCTLKIKIIYDKEYIVAVKEKHKVANKAV